MNKRFWSLATLVLALVLSSIALHGQEYRSTISGSVTDPSGAAVTGAKITITEVRTNTRTQTTSDKSGQYVVPFLAPGKYQVDVDAPGFKRYIRKAFTLNSGDHPVIDVKLEIGSTSETVNVTDEAPLVDTANSSMGQTITTKEVEDFPLNGRNPMMLAQLAIGVVATGTPSMVHPFDNAGASAWSIGGTPSQSSEILLDGSPNATWDNRVAYSVPQDAVQEVKVKAFDVDAAYGHTGAGTINQILKTGTNQFHGSVYEFTQPSALAANTYFNDRKNIKKQDTTFNQFGVTAGGPLRIPHVYDGRDKLFWFFAFEKLKDGQPNTDFTTVPTAAERNGDFSALLNIPGGSSCIAKTGYNCYQIFNPYSGVLNGKTVSRQPFAGNIIPTTMLNPVALAYLKLFPLPNTTGNSDGFQNYANSTTTSDNYSNELGRLDYNMSERSRLSFDIRHNNEFQTKNYYFNNPSTGSNLTRENWGATVDEVYTFNTTTLLDVRANYTRMAELHGSPSDGFDPTTLGFPSYIASNSQYLQMPYISFTGNGKGSCGKQTSFQCLGPSGSSRTPSQSYQLFGDLVKVIGNHTLKFGVDLRQYSLDAFTYGNSTGSYTFNSSWTNGPTTSAAPANFGQDFAAFMLGLPSSGSFDLNARGTYHSYYYAGFVQDDWRATPTLTVNLGVRYDHDTPYYEKLGRTVNGFDFTATNPISAAASAAYDNNPVSQIPAGSFVVPGGLTYPSGNNGAVYQNSSHWVSPRVGFAWSPAALHSKTVIRGGFGIFVQPLTISNLSVVGKYSSNPILDQEGFSQTTPMIISSNYLQPASTLSDPFPNGFLAPSGSADGLATYDGQKTVSFLAPDMKNPYAIRWTLGVQHEFNSNLLLEVAYIGNHSLHLPVSVTQLNVIPRQYLSTATTRDQALITTLTGAVANPFHNLLPGTSLNGKTVPLAQLLSAYPQYGVGEGSGSQGLIEQNATIGSSTFNSLNVRLEKRLSNGLSLTGVYMFSKLIEQDTWLNDTDTHLEKRISPFDHTHHFVLAGSYALPIGRGKLVNVQSRWADYLVGGWHVNGIYSYQTGAPIEWANGSTTNIGDYVYSGGPLNLNNRQTTGTAFDTTQFATKSTDQFQYHIRTFPTTFSNLRQDGINNIDASILKDVKFTESKYVQLRVEAFNLVNHPTFAAPSTSVTSSSFGEITSQANQARTIQFGARFVF